MSGDNDTGPSSTWILYTLIAFVAFCVVAQLVVGR
jgi:hypothetical protein